MFTERSNMEQRIAEAEAQIAGHKRNIEGKLNELAPQKRKEYLELQAENGQLQLEKTRLENALQAINEDILVSRQEISVDHNKRHATRLLVSNIAPGSVFQQTNNKTFQLKLPIPM